MGLLGSRCGTSGTSVVSPLFALICSLDGSLLTVSVCETPVEVSVGHFWGVCETLLDLYVLLMVL
jgi:hypothetical protein